ncbi:hypothetical protein NY406_10875 [Chlorobaculum sp. MV4-Y]|uniref:hypothetical protein n=1 Tax=Chlorobaculum sp. MV4-Y TaxID=2976335 RepID=UPI0021AEDCC2|nr:hypothetical protein [Chlorobaculum sp. MV4-Y]UWX57673.1 hypothetical protein NY406_10875 [Chlorobaculum sp. MV4-Y]
MNVLKSAEKPFAGFVDRPGKIFGPEDGSNMASYELGVVDVTERRPFGFDPEPFRKASPPVNSPEIFDIGSLLRLRTFAYLLLGTVLFLVQISNTLAINDLAKRNERLREQLRISTSISTAEELKSRELQSIRYISGYAKNLGLDSSFIPPVEIEP